VTSANTCSACRALAENREFRRQHFCSAGGAHGEELSPEKRTFANGSASPEKAKKAFPAEREAGPQQFRNPASSKDSKDFYRYRKWSFLCLCRELAQALR
jgi:hypothetical protein